MDCAMCEMPSTSPDASCRVLSLGNGEVMKGCECIESMLPQGLVRERRAAGLVMKSLSLDLNLMPACQSTSARRALEMEISQDVPA